MITTLIILVFFGTVILWVNYRSASFRWLGAFFFAISLNVFAYLIDRHFPDAPHVLVNSMFLLRM